jgi:hypothetical protein
MALHRTRVYALLFLAVALKAPQALAQGTTTPTGPSVPSKVLCKPEVSNGGRSVLVNWKAAADCLDRPNSEWVGRLSARIDEDTAVAIRSTHFNFIKYTIKYQIDETVVESYVLLARLWQGILGLPPDLLPGLAIRTTSSSSTLLQWADALIAAQRTLEVAGEQAPAKAYLTDDQIAAVAANVQSLTDARAAVMKAYAALPPLGTYPEFEQYTKIKAFHDAVIARLDAYLDLASLTVDGQVKTIPKKKGGTIVTVTMTPASNAGADRAPVLIVEYFSHSRLPVTFHAGYTWASLDDIDFEKVAAFSGSDMFAEVKTNQNTQSFTAFMTYEPRTYMDEKFGAGVSIGTDIVKPGQRLFLGGSVRYSRFVFTMAVCPVN